MSGLRARGRRENSYDVVIVGAGILGCALAAAFGKQGRRVLLLERDLSEPDRIVGELLQPGGVSALEKLGLRGEFSLFFSSLLCSSLLPPVQIGTVAYYGALDCLEGIDAIKVFGYECIYHGERVTIAYPKGADGKAPEGRSFHHGKFIMKLREAARKTPKCVNSVPEMVANGGNSN